ncbi:MAG: hypothetical protein JF571_05575, partial [Asticcacaulis sp.]|nr:hypothetical protein [Asticcacaulis sp.]
MRAILISLGVLAVAAGLASPVFAGDVLTAPPSPPVSPSDIDSPSKATFARSFAIGSLKGQLGGTALRGFVSQAGSGKIQQMAGNGVAMSWV